MRSVSPHLPLLLLLVACQSEPPQGEFYYDRVIQPILSQSCSRGVSGCHSVDASDPFAFAAGNFDTTSFENVHKRPDLLRTVSAFPAPFLLMKAAAETPDLQIAYRDKSYPSLVTHVGLSVLKVGSPAFLTLQTWLENGATRDGVRPTPTPVMGSGCSSTIPAGFDEAGLMATPEWQSFSGEFDSVQQVINAETCNGQGCHGAPQSDFYLTCGGDVHQKAFNFLQVWSFTGSPVDTSEFLRRPVAGGSSHTGGAHFATTDAAGYQTLKKFAMDVGPRTYGVGDPARTFFADRVMPILIQRGCTAEGCHSPAAMNDFKLRPGTQGFFSPVSLEKNYQLAKVEFLAFEVPDIRRGRLIAKNILPTNGGINHRGGPLLENGTGADPTLCPGTYDPANPTLFCTFLEWARLERGNVGNPNAGGSIPVVYVERDPSHTASLLDFTRYQGGSDLKVSTATLDAAGHITSLPAGASLLGGCPGSAGTRDVRAPDVKNDGDTVVFALRADTNDTLHIYTVKISAPATCTQITNDAGMYDFDPAWSPDDGASIVFASSRAGGMSKRLNLPQSDLWRMDANGANKQRMTVLSNSEIGPQFMREGRVCLTTEKVDAKNAATGFYQLSGRRINWDLTDYHPLLAQRSQSPVDPGKPMTALPSVGFQQATEIREDLNGNFLLVFSNAGARYGAGTIGVFNRSVGPFEADRTDPGYMVSVTIPDRAGVYRSPAPLLDGQILASYAPGVTDPATATSFPFQLVALEPHTGVRTPLLAVGGKALVEAVVALRYPARPLYLNRRQLVFGTGAMSGPSDASHAVVHFPDLPMLATLLGANLRRGRHVEELATADTVTLFDANGSSIGSAPLASDGSAKIAVRSLTPVYIGVFQGGSQLFMMTEEHQFGPGEQISIGVRREVFDRVCAGCHGSNSGREIDVGISADVLTSASQSMSLGSAPAQVGP